MEKLNEIQKRLNSSNVSESQEDRLVEIPEEDLRWLIEGAKKYQHLQNTWEEGKARPNYDIFHFVRACKAVMENDQIPKEKL